MGVIPNKVGADDGGAIVRGQRVSECVELELSGANCLRHSVLDRLQWRQQLTEEVINDVDDDRLCAGRHEVIQRLASRPRLPRLVLPILVPQLLLNQSINQNLH